jgi:hypothetical protein
MKQSLSALAIILAGGLVVAAPSAFAAESKVFPLTVSKGAQGCLPEANGRVTLNSLGIVEEMHVEVNFLPPNSDFDVFVIQVPNAPFGLAWYQGDIETDAGGSGVSDFFGRFSVETFIVAPGVAQAPKVFPTDATKNPATPPVQLYHVGIWFNSPKQALNLGCTAALVVTPFNGAHNAGIQVLNTGTFGPLNGPLRNFK